MSGLLNMAYRIICIACVVLLVLFVDVGGGRHQRVCLGHPVSAGDWTEVKSSGEGSVFSFDNAEVSIVGVGIVPVHGPTLGFGALVEFGRFSWETGLLSSVLVGYGVPYPDDDWSVLPYRAFSLVVGVAGVGARAGERGDAEVGVIAYPFGVFVEYASMFGGFGFVPLNIYVRCPVGARFHVGGGVLVPAVWSYGGGVYDYIPPIMAYIECGY